MDSAKHPIRVYLGEYEAFVLKLYGRNQWLFVDKHLEKFFSYFPHDMSLEAFTTAEVTDYRVWRKREGITAPTVRVELGAVTAFWKWLIQMKGLPFLNPVVNSKPPRPRTTNRLSLEDFRRLYKECDDRRLRRFLLDSLVDVPTRDGFQSKRLNKGLRDAADRAGLKWITTAKQLRGAIRYSLWREIVRGEYPKIRQALFHESKTLGDAPADIQTSPIYIRPAIEDDDSDPVPVARVDEYESCT